MAPPVCKNPLPLHVGIIMDGNRRWAKKHGTPMITGHSRGAEAFKSLATHCNKIGLKNLTVFAFSTENWNRSQEEVAGLMFIFKKYLKSVMKEFKNEQICVKFLGNISKFSEDIKNMVSTIESETKNRKGLRLNIAMNYGARDEITKSAQNLVKKALSGTITATDITPERFESELYTAGIPDVDLIIRTAGEKRLSNFLLWQSAYAEFYFTDVLWPDFSCDEFDKAIDDYSSRTRRFGGA